MKTFIQISIIFLICLSCSKDVEPEIIPNYSLKASVTPVEGGTVTPSEGNYQSGATVSLRGTPSPEYLFKEWIGSITGTTNPISVTMNSNKNITGVFEKRKYPLSITIEGEGTVSEELISSKPTGEYPSGSVIKLTGLPSEGWEFVGWTGDIESSELEVRIVVNKPLEVIAKFIKIFEINVINIDHSMYKEIWTCLGGTTSSNLIFEKSGVRHFISHPAFGRTAQEIFFPTLHMTKTDDKWKVSHYYEGINMSVGGRDVHPFGNNNDYVWADHGTEVWLGGGEGTPFNNIWVGKNISSSGIDWIKVNEYRSFYHGVSSGDLNHDGLIDIVGVHQGTNAPKEDEKYQTYYHVFLQKADGTFEQDFNTLSYPNSPLPSWFSWQDSNYSECLGVIRGSILIEDITGDGYPEIIGGAYIHREEWDVPLKAQNSLEIFTDPDLDGIYTVLNYQKRIGNWEYDNIGSTQIKLTDYDNDGDKDLVVSLEGSKGISTLEVVDYNGVQVLNNLGQGQFEYSGIEIPFEDVRIWEFELLDVDNDNDLDIVFNASLSADLGQPNSFFYSDNNRLIKNLIQIDDYYFSAILDLDEMIYYNEGGTFIKKDNNYKIKINKAIPIFGSEKWGAGLKTLNATIVDGKLLFYGYITDLDLSKSVDDPDRYIIKIFEYEPIIN